MRLFRRLVPLFSALLVALVAVQALDLVACADEAQAASATGGFHVDEAVGAGAHPTPAPGADHGDGGGHEEMPGLSDCFCHVVFTRTDHVPEVASAQAATPLPYAPYEAHPTSAAAPPLDHVPL